MNLQMKIYEKYLSILSSDIFKKFQPKDNNAFLCSQKASFMKLINNEDNYKIISVSYLQRVLLQDSCNVLMYSINLPTAFASITSFNFLSLCDLIINGYIMKYDTLVLNSIGISLFKQSKNFQNIAFFSGIVYVA